MQKREAQFTQLFRHWLKANPNFTTSAAFELKQTGSNSLPFSAVVEHQITGLQAANSSTGILFKLPDDSRGIKPFDLFYLKDCPAYVVIKYPLGFEIITIGTFLREKAISKRKSLTHSRAKEISVVSVKTK